MRRPLLAAGPIPQVPVVEPSDLHRGSFRGKASIQLLQDRIESSQPVATAGLADCDGPRARPHRSPPRTRRVRRAGKRRAQRRADCFPLRAGGREASGVGTCRGCAGASQANRSGRDKAALTRSSIVIASIRTISARRAASADALRRRGAMGLASDMIQFESGPPIRQAGIRGRFSRAGGRKFKESERQAPANSGRRRHTPEIGIRSPTLIPTLILRP